jgi:hypothetical protein
VETLILLAAAAVIVLVVAFAIDRRRRAEVRPPARLGPRWTPIDDDAADDPEAAAERAAERDHVVAVTGLDDETVTTVLTAWWEYLSALRVRPLPRTHPYRFYDPYDPPIAERGPDGPIPDPKRVARDLSQRTPVAEIEALQALSALRERAPRD